MSFFTLTEKKLWYNGTVMYQMVMELLYDLYHGIK